jgi:hypothetical protein
MTADYKEGIKKDVAEIKFLIHDLRVERFINEIIHFHVTVNTDLEIYSLEQAQILHSDDLQVLKAKAVGLRKAFQDYSTAVKNFSPDATVLQAGNHYVETIYNTCELILNPLWGRVDKVLTFLPPEARSVRSRDAYRNSIRWIRGVSSRIKHFLDEQQGQDTYEEFGISAEIENFTGEVIEGYVNEKGGASVRLQLDRLDPAVIGGNRFRFRRMYFNLVMNSVDAVANRKVGVLNISDTVEGDRVVLRVRDNGAGIASEKIEQLLKDRATLDGDLHSLGFVFVRQTVAGFGGELSIESEVGEGTTIAISFPRLPESAATSRRFPDFERGDGLPWGKSAERETTVFPAEAKEEATPAEARDAAIPPETKEATATVEAEDATPPTSTDSFGRAARREDVSAERPPAAGGDRDSTCGRLIYEDYQKSEAQYPGSIFGIALDEEGAIEFFSHRSYDRYSNITHEDLSPMCYDSTFRGRLERGSLGEMVLTLKEPRNVREFFEFKNVPENERSPEKHVQMVHDEYIRIARKLIITGLPSEVSVELTGLNKFFPVEVGLPRSGPFPLELLASRPLSTEQGD